MLKCFVALVKRNYIGIEVILHTDFKYITKYEMELFPAHLRKFVHRNREFLKNVS